MEQRLIDANALLNLSFRITGSFDLGNGRKQEFESIPVIEIEQAPTVDAVPVVRCRECIWFLGKHILHDDGTIELVDEHSKPVTTNIGINCQAKCKRLGYINNLFVSDSGNGFCSYGERREIIP